METHGHHHHELSGKNLGISIVLNISIAVAELIGGIFSGSMALIGDAVHNFSDVLSLLISYFANKLTKRKATEKQTFGYRRSEIIAAFINSATLIILAIFILTKAIQRIYEPVKITPEWIIYLAVASIIINGLSVLLINKDAKKNINIKSAYLHLFSDMLTSIAVLAGGLAMKFFSWYMLDSFFSIAIALYLIYMSWNIFISSLKILMQFTPEGIDIKEISLEIEKIKGIKNIHHLHVWQINEHDIIFGAHIDLLEDKKISDFENILEMIKIILHKNNIEHYTIQPEFMTNDNKQLIQEK